MVEEAIAEKMARDMKEVSVAEFFEKNRHLLGYENSTKALLTVVKEAVDNSLDATTEAGILPEIKISVKTTNTDRLRYYLKTMGLVWWNQKFLLLLANSCTAPNSTG